MNKVVDADDNEYENEEVFLAYALDVIDFIQIV